MVSGLVRRFGPVVALDGVELAVGRGELFVLLGGSGSGKTTLLRCLGGFETPDAGRVTLDGRDLLALPAWRRPVNTMFQSYALFPHMTVARNVAFGLRGLPRRDITARIEEMLALVQLDGYGGRRPDELSGGQRQRVALARALARRPQLLLLDEPLSALDRGLREATRRELVALQRRLGTTFVLVTHDQEEALGMATRLGVMRAGRLVQVGTPQALYERPVDRFVAEFLGAANILRGIVRDPGEGRIVLPGLGEAIVPTVLPMAAGATVDVALRPERLHLAAARQGANQLTASLDSVAYRGDALVLTVILADGARLTLVRPPGEPPAIGTPLNVAWPPAAAIVLPT